MAIFAKFDKIDGEAVDKDHKDWIEIESAGWDHHRAVMADAKASQRTRGETSIGDIHVTCPMHKGSMKVQQACAAGQVIDKIEIHFCRSGADEGRGVEAYLIAKLDNVLLTSYATSIAGQDVPIEHLTLNFTKIEMEYKASDPSGKLSTTGAFTWDRETSAAA